MINRSLRLFPSLVGSSIDFSFKKGFEGSLTLEKNLRSEKEKIRNVVESALSAGGEVCVMLLAELTSYYLKTSYYMAVRSSIEMRRFRPYVLDYLKLSIQERADRLRAQLSVKSNAYRQLKVQALKYFLDTYPSRTKDFKKLLTKEEFMTVV